MLIRFIQQSDKLLFDAPAKASPVQGEVAKIFDFCRRGCTGTVFLFALAYNGLISLFCTIPQSLRDNRLRAVRSRL